jgi:dipeptidyl aminopeptidase/acylaminoacyl peptidase
MTRFSGLALAVLLAAVASGRLFFNPAMSFDRGSAREFEARQQASTAATQAAPDTEIYLAPLSKGRDGMLSVGSAGNITNNPGYDNQPSFTPDGRAIFFTSSRGAERSSSAARDGGLPDTDIYRYDIGTRQTVSITATPQREYSPTVTPDGRHLSVVRVEADGTQRLWQFTLEGTDPQLLLPEVKPVGYHAWASERTVALFVLGSPATLQLADVGSGKAEVIARDVGRSLQRIPSGGISYVQRHTSADSEAALSLMRLDPVGKSVERLVDFMKGDTEPYVAWTPDGVVLVAHAESLYQWRAGGKGWQTAAGFARLGLHGVTRLAVSPRGDRLAIVAQPQPQ